MIEVEHLSKRYPGVERLALDDVTFTVRAGTFCALLGPNGAGKSTLMSILATSMRPTSGCVRIAGIDGARAPRQVLRKVSFIFQESSLDSLLTLEENVRVGVAMSGTSAFRPAYRLMPAAYRAELERNAELLDLRDDLFVVAKNASGGTQRRAEILRALMVQPSVLILDEPTAGLDPATRKRLWQHIRHLHQHLRATVLLATHYLDEAEQAEQIVVLQRGRVRIEATPAALQRKFARRSMVVDADDRRGLSLDLERLGVRFSGDGPFTIDDPMPAHELIAGISVRLSALDVHQPTLEEAYLVAVASKDDDG